MGKKDYNDKASGRDARRPDKRQKNGRIWTLRNLGCKKTDSIVDNAEKVKKSMGGQKNFSGKLQRTLRVATCEKEKNIISWRSNVRGKKKRENLDKRTC